MDYQNDLSNLFKRMRTSINNSIQKKTNDKQPEVKKQGTLFENKNLNLNDDLYNGTISFSKKKKQNDAPQKTNQKDTTQYNIEQTQIAAQNSYLNNLVNNITSNNTTTTYNQNTVKKENTTTTLSDNTDNNTTKTSNPNPKTEIEKKYEKEITNSTKTDSSQNDEKYSVSELLTAAQTINEIAKEYSKKLSNRKLQFVYNFDGSNGETKTEDLSYFSLKNNAKFVGDYRVIDTSGNIIISSAEELPQGTEASEDGFYYSEDGKKYIIAPDISNISYFQNGLRNGSISLQQATTSNDQTSWNNVNWQNLSMIQDVYNTSDDAMAQALYEAKIADLNYQALLKYLIDNTSNNDNIDLSNTLKKISDEYIEKMTNKTINLIYNFDNSDAVKKEPLTYFSLKSNSTFIGNYRTVDKSGNIIISSLNEISEGTKVSEDGFYYSEDGKKYIVSPEIANEKYFQKALMNGDINIEKASIIDTKDSSGNQIGEKTIWLLTSWKNLPFISEDYDTSDDAMAESEYYEKLGELTRETIEKYAKENS